MSATNRTACALVGLVFLAAVGCAMDAWLWPFGSYYYFGQGLTGQGPDLLGSGASGGGLLTTGGNGTTGGTTGGTTTTGGSVPNVDDDFADGNLDGWSRVSGNWAVNSGGWVQATGPAIDGYYIMVLGEDTWTDYEVSLDIRLDAGSEYAVGVRWVNDETWYHCSHTVGGIASVSKFVSGSPDRRLSTGSSTPLLPGEWYHWRIVVQGNSISLYVEGEQAVSATDAESPITAGKVALLVAPGAQASFDNIQVSPVGG